MKVDYSPRRSGKTTRMIAWLREDEHRGFVAFSESEKARLQFEYPDVKDQIYCFETRKDIGRNLKSVVIDNADLLLQRMFECPIDTISLSKED